MRFGAPMTVEDVSLLVDLFYLPYAHGVRAKALLELLDRLQAGADSNAVFETLSREFVTVATAVTGLFTRLTEITQRELCYSIYPYMWDIKEELDLLERYVGWLGRGGGSGSGSAVYPDDELPTTIYPKFEQIYRGGILAELQRRVPLARGVHDNVRAGVVAHFRHSVARL